MITTAEPPRDGTCFFESDPLPPLARRAAAEAIGTFTLVFTVVGSALAWTARGPVGPVAQALSVGPVLTALILAFGLVSGGHFNPLITFSQWAARRRGADCFLAYVAAQMAGAGLAARCADLMLGGASPPAGPPVVLPRAIAGEVFATAGLMLIVLAAPRMRPHGVGPFAVGSWVSMTVLALPGGPAANPAITLALALTRLAPAPDKMVAHLLAEVVGLAIGAAAITVTSPAARLQHGIGAHVR